jgi:hypothetical protein
VKLRCTITTYTNKQFIDAPDMDVSDVEPAYDFVSDGPEDGEMVMGEGETCPSCDSPVEDCECEGHGPQVRRKRNV